MVIWPAPEPTLQGGEELILGKPKQAKKKGEKKGEKKGKPRK